MKYPWPQYTGTLNTRSKDFDPIAKKAQGIYNSQCQRCTNPKAKAYKNYGAKGIRVEYSARDFIGWYLWQLSMKKLSFPSVGRIDHSKNYSFDNIELIEHADNAREMYDRTGGNKTVERTPVVLVDDAAEVTHVFKSNVEAAKFAGVTPSYIALRKRVPGQKIKRFPYRVFDLDKFMGLENSHS